MHTYGFSSTKLSKIHGLTQHGSLPLISESLICRQRLEEHRVAYQNALVPCNIDTKAIGGQTSRRLRLRLSGGYPLRETEQLASWGRTWMLDVSSIA